MILNRTAVLTPFCRLASCPEEPSPLLPKHPKQPFQKAFTQEAEALHIPGQASLLDKFMCRTHQMSRRLLLSSKKALT